MYNISIILVVLGFLFTIFNVILLLKSYKFCLINNKNQKILIPNILIVISSFLMLVLGVVYFLIINGQLR